MMVAWRKEEFQKWYQKHEKEVIDDWLSYLKIPSVSADSKHRKDVLACADWVEAYLQKAKLKTMRLEGSAFPIILGEKIHSQDAPTVLLYGHYDVQPPDPLDLWKSPPFEPEIRDGRVYARGAADNKGQSCAMIAAVRALLEINKDLPLNFKVFIEGEEEVGSPSFSKVAKKYQKKLAADYLILVDMGIDSLKKPCISLGVRGITTFDIHIKNSDMDLHSGEFGGVVKNPNMILCKVLSDVIDEKGHIAIPGFYDDVKPLTKEEKAELTLTKSEEIYTEETGAKVFHCEEGYTLHEANVLRPTFEINGICGGYIGEGSKTVLPSEAFAKLSCRLVPNQDPKKVQKCIESYFRERFPKGLQVTFDWHGGGFAAWASPKTKSAKIFQEATEEVLGKTCSFDFSGGSIPITYEFAEIAGVKEFITVGTGIATDRIHSPNESFSLEQFKADFLILCSALMSFAEKP